MDLKACFSTTFPIYPKYIISMKGTDHVFDRIMLGIGTILLILFCIKFPVLPSMDEQHYASYASPYEETISTSKWTYLKPSKSLNPREVVRIQLKALQQNDHRDSGVITVFNFSSPKNRMHIGSLNHFRLLVRNPAYSTMLNFKSYRAGQLVVTGNTAYQLAVIVGNDDREEVFLFILAKQKKGKYKGCWMTEGIARMEPGKQTSLV